MRWKWEKGDERRENFSDLDYYNKNAKNQPTKKAKNKKRTSNNQKFFFYYSKYSI